MEISKFPEIVGKWSICTRLLFLLDTQFVCRINPTPTQSWSVASFIQENLACDAEVSGTEQTLCKFP